MNKKPMKFKSFKWPNNPEVVDITYGKRLVKHDFPEITGSETEDLGSESRTFSGSGVFFGRNAYKNFTALQKLYREMTPGNLYHPTWGNYTVRFTNLKAKEVAYPNYVEYEFEFIEHINISKVVTVKKVKPKAAPSSSHTIYTVVKGDCLWKISRRYYGAGRHWRRIANANKGLIKNPDLIYPGWKLKIPK